MAKVGRPLKFEPLQFKKDTDAYFKLPAITRKNFPDLPTKSGLLLHLGMNRENWSSYKEKPEFLDTIKEAENKIEEAWVQYLKRPQVAGIIFYLKNAFKEHYRDTYDHTSGGEKLPTPIIPIGNVHTNNGNESNKGTK